MVFKYVLMIMVMIFGSVVSVAQASTRTDAPIELAKIDDPASEMQCLEAFVKSDFIYAHRLCLVMAQKGVKDAQLVTGLMYALGAGTEKNPEFAKLWLKEAMRNGSGEAKEALIQFNLLD